ncbi:MAG: RidA family protein [Rhodobacteraceae bacterium]|nr:RidA family protein [Paracoccaceae bacterium]
MKSLGPASIAPPFARYAHGVEIQPGQRIVRTSGQLALGRDGSVPPDAYDQARLCFGNIIAILAEAGMGADDVFHVSAFVTDRAHMQGYMKARDQFLADTDAASLPTSTLVIVSGFTRPEFKVEVEVWAAAP